jgi:NAD(P)-dependent dehydrogenase (short-subunit alcohol dehydrogenase family)
LSLQGVRVLVVGGSSGIGEAATRQFAEQGAQVTIASRSADKLAGALGRLPAGVSCAVLDVSDEPQVAAFFAANAAWQHVVLAGSATQTGPVRDPGGLTLAAARASMDNKFWGAYHVGRHARITAGGSLTLMSGVYSQRPNPAAVLQGVMNAAVEALARGLALELAPLVRVNTVSPSTTDTPLWDKLGLAGREAKLAAMRARLPLQRVAEAADIAQAIVYLATNAFSTGTTLLVDGGDALA